MRGLKTALAFILALLMAGCVVSSLYPLFTEKDLAFDPTLVGTWAEKDEDDTLTFALAEGKAYELTYTAEGQKTKYEGHLVQLGEFKFLDVYPKISEEHDAFHLIPAHSFWRIRMDGDVLSIAGLDEDWFKNATAKKEIAIAHERLEHGIVLTASTDVLQKFVLKYADSAFSDFGEFHRQK